MRFRLNQFLAFQNPPDGLSLIDGEAGKIGDCPLYDFLTLANGFTQENGGGRFPVGHDVDIRG